MIPRRKPSGRKALRKLRVYSGVPETLSKIRFDTIQDSKATKPLAFYVSVSDIASRIGWKGGVGETTP